MKTYLILPFAMLALAGCVETITLSLKLTKP
jgi:hypothetical protein